MKPLVRLVLVIGLAGLAVGLAACDENPVGRICFIGADAGTETQSIVSSPALECQARTCLHVTSQSPGQEDLCTAECSGDDDCDKVGESPCMGGFTCMVPVTVGAFCCKKMCVCRDYVTIPDGGVPVPQACEPSNPDNLCCNLPDRQSCF